MRIVNLGSLNLDHAYGLDHFVTEGETILCDRYAVLTGGKGLNQSIALASAGVKVYHAGAVGADGALLKSALTAAGADTSLIVEARGVSGHAVIQQASGHNCIIVYPGANRQLDEGYIDKVLEHFEAGDILLTQNEVSCVAHAIRSAKARGMRVVFNASPVNAALKAYPLDDVDYLLINEIEGEQLLGEPCAEHQRLIDALSERYPHTAVIMTVGGNGVYYRDRTQSLYNGVYDICVRDTTAAGDTFCGYFVACLAKRFTLPRSLQFASLASNLAVTRVGSSVSIPLWSEVEAFERVAVPV